LLLEEDEWISPDYNEDKEVFNCLRTRRQIWG